MKHTKAIFLFNLDYGAGSFYRCFLTDDVDKVAKVFPEFKFVPWDKVALPEDQKSKLIGNAFDIDSDPNNDEMLKALLKERIREAEYQKWVKKNKK